MPGVAEADPRSTDPGDSILAAEAAAAERVVDGLDPKRTRVGIVSFAGEAVLRYPGDLAHPPVRRAALTQEPLTSGYRRVRDGVLIYGVEADLDLSRVGVQRRVPTFASDGAVTDTAICTTWAPLSR